MPKLQTHNPPPPPKQLFKLFQQSAQVHASGKGSGVRDIDGDTSVMPQTEDAALRAAGAVRVVVWSVACLGHVGLARSHARSHTPPP